YLRRRLLRLGDFFSRLWRRLDLSANTRPLAVILKRFAELLCVLSFGMNHDLLVRALRRRGLFARAPLLPGALFGRKNDGHLPAFHEGRALQIAHFRQHLGHLQQPIPHQIRMDNLPAAETDVDLNPIAFPQEALGAPDLHFDVVPVGLGAQAELLDRRRLLLLARLPLFLGLLVLKTAKVHQPTDWRPRLGGHLHEIQFGLLCDPQGLPNRHDPQLLTVSANHPDLSSTNLVVDTPFPANVTPPPQKFHQGDAPWTPGSRQVSWRLRAV